MSDTALVPNPNRNNLPRRLLIFPLERKPLFPGMLSQLTVEKEEYMKIIDLAMKREHYIGLLLVKELDIENRYRFSNLYRVGTIAKIHKKINLPDGGYNVFITVQDRFKIVNEQTLIPPLQATVEYISDNIEHNKELTALTRSLISEMKPIIENNPIYSEEIRLNMVNIDHPGQIADFITSILDLKKEEQQKILEISSIHNRIIQVLTYINREQELLYLQKKIRKNITDNVEKQRKEHFLREMIQEIQKELGEPTDSKSIVIEEMYKQLEALSISDEIHEQIEKEIVKFSNLETHHPEYAILHSYLERVLSLPWNDSPPRDITLDQTSKILHKDHYGLDKVKNRIIEFLAISKIRKAKARSILCLVGPPGVGKTSIARSIANGLKKKLYHFSVGGMRDEAEIRGHRRTYIGAMPGKIIQGLLEVKEKDPIFVIDEIDKISTTYMGDPSSALLEILDPVQNTHFRDLYIDIPFDLSKIFFITTANTTSSIPPALLDRMEMIYLSGYIDKEKIEIAKKYIVPKSLKDHGLAKNTILFETQTLKQIAEQYARESGMRKFEQQVNKIVRKIITQYLQKEEQKINEKVKENKEKSTQKKEKNEQSKNTTNNKEKTEKLNNEGILINTKSSYWPKKISTSVLKEYLGIPPFQENIIKRASTPGTSIGLAWTSMGGDVLVIETQKYAGKGFIKLTGKLGDVMKESAHIALSLIKSKNIIELFSIETDIFTKNDFHIHFPEGATPKDGPSAGITIASALLSLVTNTTIVNNYAMTGELSLVGNILPIGGLREKIVAANRNKIKHIIIPKSNINDLEEIPSYVYSGITIHPVVNIIEVFELLFPKIKNKMKNKIVHSSKTNTTVTK